MTGVTNLKAGQKWTSFVVAEDNNDAKSTTDFRALDKNPNATQTPGYVLFIVKSQTDKYDIATPAPADKVEVADPAKVTDAELDKIKEKLQLEYNKKNDDANIAKNTAVDKDGKIKSVTKDDKGNLVVTYTDGSTDTKPLSEFVTKKPTTPAKDADGVKDPAKTPVKDPANLTDAEKAKVADEVKKANPTAKDVEVGKDGTATVTFPDGSTAVIPSGDTVKKSSDNAVKDPAAKTVVANPDKLTDAEKKAIEAKVQAVNPGAKVVVDDKGNATVTPKDGEPVVIPASDLVIPSEKLADAATDAKVKTPAIRTLVDKKDTLTDSEKEAVKKAIEAVNSGATVVVDNKGNATVTTPSGDTAAITNDLLVKDSKDTSDKNKGNNINLDFDKVLVTDLHNITKEEKVQFQFKLLGAINSKDEFDLGTFLKTTDAEGNTVYTSKDPKSNVTITIDKDGNMKVTKEGKTQLVVTFEANGTADIVTEDGKVLAVTAEDIFKQRPYVPSNGGGNNGANNTDAKVNKAKLEGAISQLDELIIKESVKLDAETAKEANALSADAKKVFANADATQAEVDAMVKRIEDFMAKVAPSTDHATPANDQTAQTPAVAPATTQAAANAGQTASAQANERKAAKELPNTGTADSSVAMVAAAASAVLGLGLAGRRRKEDEEA